MSERDRAIVIRDACRADEYTGPARGDMLWLLNEVSMLRKERDALLKGRRDWQEQVERDAYLSEQGRSEEALGALGELVHSVEAVAMTMVEHTADGDCAGPNGTGRRYACSDCREAATLLRATSSPLTSLSTAYRAKVRREALEEAADAARTDDAWQQRDRGAIVAWLRALAAKGGE